MIMRMIMMMISGAHEMMVQLLFSCSQWRSLAILPFTWIIVRTCTGAHTRNCFLNNFSRLLHFHNLPRSFCFPTKLNVLSLLFAAGIHVCRMCDGLGQGAYLILHKTYSNIYYHIIVLWWECHFIFPLIRCLSLLVILF